MVLAAYNNIGGICRAAPKDLVHPVELLLLDLAWPWWPPCAASPISLPQVMISTWMATWEPLQSKRTKAPYHYSHYLSLFSDSYLTSTNSPHQNFYGGVDSATLVVSTSLLDVGWMDGLLIDIHIKSYMIKIDWDRTTTDPLILGVLVLIQCLDEDLYVGCRKTTSNHIAETGSRNRHKLTEKTVGDTDVPHTALDGNLLYVVVYLASWAHQKDVASLDQEGRRWRLIVCD